LLESTMTHSSRLCGMRYFIHVFSGCVSSHT
jgi:hypothetical protein